MSWPGWKWTLRSLILVSWMIGTLPSIFNWLARNKSQSRYPPLSRLLFLAPSNSSSGDWRLSLPSTFSVLSCLSCLSCIPAINCLIRFCSLGSSRAPRRRWLSLYQLIWLPFPRLVLHLRSKHLDCKKGLRSRKGQYPRENVLRNRIRIKQEGSSPKCTYICHSVTFRIPFGSVNWWASIDEEQTRHPEGYYWCKERHTQTTV